jgi:hypothetical protein
MPVHKNNDFDDLGRVRDTVQIEHPYPSDPKPVRIYGGGRAVPVIPMQAETSPSIMLATARWEREARADRRETWNSVFMAIGAVAGVIAAIEGLIAALL